MASFLSRSNTREDGYGGEITNRVKLPLEVYSRVRKEVGDDFVVGCPVSRGRMHRGRSNIDDAVYFGTELREQEWTSCHCHAVASLTMPSSRRWATQAYPNRSQRLRMHCPSYYSDAAGPFGAISIHRANSYAVRPTGHLARRL